MTHSNLFEWVIYLSRVTESNHRSSYHGHPIGSPTRHFGERPSQTLYFSSVGTGSGRFAPDAASQIPPNRLWRKSHVRSWFHPARSLFDKRRHRANRFRRVVSSLLSADRSPPAGDYSLGPVTPNVADARRWVRARITDARQSPLASNPVVLSPRGLRPMCVAFKTICYPPGRRRQPDDSAQRHLREPAP